MKGKETRKKNIINAAKELFAVKGYAATGLREIADKAGVSLGNIYNHFKNKEEIFTHIFNPEDIAGPLLSKLHALSEKEDYPYNMEEIILAVIKTIDENIELYALTHIDIIEFGSRNITKMLEYMMEVGNPILISKLKIKIAEGQFRDVNYEFLLKYLVLTVISFFSSIRLISALNLNSYSESEIAHMIADIIINGIKK
jgi:AcrR family transcriptional regulator